MSFYRLYPVKDTFIANGDPPAVGTQDISYANMGASEIMNLYSVINPASTSTYDATGTLIASPTASIFAQMLVAFDLSGATSPPNAQYLLKMFDAQHSDTLPAGYTVFVRPVEQDWSEGNGQDLDYYTDTGVANWHSATLTTAWAAHTGIQGNSMLFETGHEDLEVDVSNFVSATSYGFSIYIDPAITGTDLYIKKFHSRQTHFVTKKPYLEIRWEDWSGTLTTSSVYVSTVGAYSGTIVPAWAATAHSATLVSTTNSLVNPTGVLVMKMPFLKPVYSTVETARVEVISALKDYNPSTVAVALSAGSGTVLMDAYYQIVNDLTEEVLVPFATGTLKYTKLSWDDAGNFFDIHMGSLPTGTLMRFDITYQVSGTWTVVRGDQFKFRVA